MATRRLSGLTTSSSVPDNGGDHSGGGGSDGFVDDLFSTYVYDGRNGPFRIRNGVDLDGEGGLVWIKCRNQSVTHQLVDTERGQSSYLSSQSSNQEIIDADSRVTYFNNDGFSLGTGGEVNNATRTYTSWTFRKAPSFFDVVTGISDASGNCSFSHNLGITPGMVIIKRTDNDVTGWLTWHRGLSDTVHDYLYLNAADKKYTAGFDVWNVTDTNVELNFGFLDGSNNPTQSEYVAYVFAHDDSEEGLIQCGSYTGNGNADGPEIDLGWEPQWLLVKSTTASGQPWGIYDVMRGMPTGGDTAYLSPDRSNEEYANQGWIDVTPRGFKLVNLNGDNFVNGSGDQYIYMAIRRSNKKAEEFEPEELFAVVDGEPNGVIPNWDSGFPVDMAFQRSATGAEGAQITSRLMQGKGLVTSSTNASYDSAGNMFDHQNGWGAFNGAVSQTSWMWRRAPGFFDVVAYEGTHSGNNGPSYTKPHSLGVVPEMMWVKNRGTANEKWPVYSKSLPITQAMWLNQNDGQATEVFYWKNAPTATEFTVGGGTEINQTGHDYIAYLFASAPGICDIGSYTGIGESAGDNVINCGFTNGARFVLIKRTDANGDWYYLDTLRGITSSTSSVLSLNTSSSESIMSLWVKPDPSGFAVWDNVVNGLGNEYIYMAIA
jgi:hypothetical protein